MTARGGSIENPPQADRTGNLFCCNLRMDMNYFGIGSISPETIFLITWLVSSLTDCGTDA